MARDERGVRGAAATGGPGLTEPGEPLGGIGDAPSRSDADRRTVLQGGRRKAYRPLPAEARANALGAAIAAYEAGDFFEAHELLEPAWMGTDVELERELYQGLIKLAAAGVHQVRGNPRGMENNLEGARARLGRVVDGAGGDAGLDLPALLASIDRSLEGLAMLPSAPARRPGSPRFAYRPPVREVSAPPLARREG